MTRLILLTAGAILVLLAMYLPLGDAAMIGGAAIAAGAAVYAGYAIYDRVEERRQELDEARWRRWTRPANEDEQP